MNKIEGINVNTFDSNQALSSSLSKRIAELLSHAIEEKGEATLVVSGGRTPKPLFAELNEQSIDWSKVTILLADERWV
ncbi:MAG TPA: 6-phosphogluconolactonase, partial [Idiomarina baltica]|nr:6-phosphogluconolactonase [Idiomarina baltica]